MDIPVAIPHAEKPVGTYVFTAVGYERGSGLQWTVVSLGPRKAPQIEAKDGVPETDTAAAMAALDRIAIPGTGPATDFIVVSSADPQSLGFDARQISVRIVCTETKQ